MVQPVKLYICYALEDKTALSNLEKCLRPFQRSDKLQFWHRDKILPGDKHAQQIITQLDQAQVIIMLITPNFFNNVCFDSPETIYAFQRHHEAGVRIIPVIAEHCAWEQEASLKDLSPLPAGGKPALKDSKAWTSVAMGIDKVATLMQAEQAKKEPDPIPYSTTTSRKSRKSAHSTSQPLSGATIVAKRPSAKRSLRPKHPDLPLRPEPPDPTVFSGAEPEPVTPEARTSSPAFDQNCEKLQHDIKQIVLDILVWEPSQPFHELVVADERRAIYRDLQAEQHQCWLGTQLQTPPGVSLQDREIQQAIDADMTILLVEAPAIGEMHAFCDDYEEDFLNKTFCFYPEAIKSSDGNWNLDETILKGFFLEYYQPDDIKHCRVRTKVLEWVEARRGCRYRKQRRSGR